MDLSLVTALPFDLTSVNSTAALALAAKVLLLFKALPPSVQG